MSITKTREVFQPTKCPLHQYFLNIISPNNDLFQKIKTLFANYPEIDLNALGFPQGWESEPLWR